MINNVLISDLEKPNFVTPNHPVLIRDSFLAAYPEFAGEFFFLPNDEYPYSTSFDQVFGFAAANNCSIFIRSTTGLSNAISLAQANYPGILTFFPAGSNSPGEVFESNGGVNLPCIVVTGAGDTANETGDDVTFISNDPITTETTDPDEHDLSSFSNRYIAGQITEIINTLDCSVWEAIYRARITGSKNGIWHETDGFGFIDVEAAIAYTGEIPLDPFIPHIGTIGSLNSTLINDKIILYSDVVDNAGYYVYEMQTESGWVEVDLNINVTSEGEYFFRYKAGLVNLYGETEETAYSEISSINIPAYYIGQAGNITFTVEGNSLTINCAHVNFADTYLIFKSSDLGKTWYQIYKGAESSFTDTIVNDYILMYKYRARLTRSSEVYELAISLQTAEHTPEGFVFINKIIFVEKVN